MTPTCYEKFYTSGSESPGGTFTLAGIFQLHRRQAGVLDKKIGANTIYGSAAHEAPMKTFIQERIATLVLAQNDLEVATMDFGVHGGIFTRIFSNDQRTRRLLQTCDLLKQLYCASGDEEYLSTFRKTGRWFRQNSTCCPDVCATTLLFTRIGSVGIRARVQRRGGIQRGQKSAHPTST